MYSTCLFCHADLGANEVVEHFPVGRRLAFDGSKGRLWVVCRSCERWNLTPLDERWEAIEECERLFRDTRLRVSTDNIGLARVREGLELVRIGEPRRPEMAAWRYGDQFGRRRKQKLLRVGLGVTVAGGVVGGAVALGYAAGVALGGSAFWIGQNVIRAARVAYERTTRGSPERVVTRVALPDGELYHLRTRHLPWIFVAPDSNAAGWSLSVHEPERKKPKRQGHHHVFEGEQALQVARQVLPAINWEGATPDEVRFATALLEGEGTSADFFARTLRRIDRAKRLDQLGTRHLLALEMAAHEDAERRALEGELHILEAAWRDAEEIAAISDDMFLPESVGEFLTKHRPARHQ